MTGQQPPPPPARGGVVRVPISTPRFSPTKFARTAVDFGTGVIGDAFARRFRRSAEQEDASALTNIDAMSFAPLATKESGAAWVFDSEGVRLEGHRRLRVTLRWQELHHVVLELQQSSMLGLQALRVAIWPVDPAMFATTHPECSALWDDTLGTYSLVLSKGPTIPQHKLDLALAGVTHAGPRFDGRLKTSSTG